MSGGLWLRGNCVDNIDLTEISVSYGRVGTS